MTVSGPAGVVSSKATDRRVEGSRSTASGDTAGLERSVVAVLALDVELVGKMEAKASRFGSAQAWRKGTVRQERGCKLAAFIWQAACTWPSGALVDWGNHSFPPDMNLSCCTGTIFEISLLNTFSLATQQLE